MSEQNYEDYWKLTLEYTDINSNHFIDTLKIIVDFIKYHKFEKVYKKERYKDLQEIINNKMPKADMASVRKSINQFVKLGFINNLASYNQEAIFFLEAKSNKKRQNLFSKIVYKYSSFNSSITKQVEQREINFLLKTLEEVGKLSKNNIIGLMTIDITKISKGYLNTKEIDDATKNADKGGFITRKYNQVGYLFNLLNKLDDVVFMNDELYFTEDAKNIFGEDLKKEIRKRDGYLHLIYKRQLQEESTEELGDKKCMLEKLSYPSLVASHIKPFIDSDLNEAYDPNNGLLLSRSMDILFDQGYITFNDDGTMIYSPRLNQDVTEHLDNYKLDNIFINENRIQYFDYHRNNVFKKSA